MFRCFGALAPVRSLVGDSQPGINPSRSGKNSLSRCQAVWKSIALLSPTLCVNNAYELEPTRCEI
jgi:hypothetical protein